MLAGSFAYPAATLFCILITGNHYWLDAFFGGLVLLGGLWVARSVERWSDARAHAGPSPAPLADEVTTSR